MNWDSDLIRAQFPSLASGAIFLDNPGGTQVPQRVIDAVSNYYRLSNSNTHGAFSTSRRTDETIAEGRRAMADLVNASSPQQIAFGPNMTTVTFNLSRALGRRIQPGDEIIVTRLDHDANIAPWLSLQERGAVIRWVDIDPEDCTLDMADYERQLSHKTRWVAVGYASNAVGTVNDLKTIIGLAHLAGALVFVDAVHYAPHGPIDVQDLDCDFLACSVYKFFGPHLGVLYGKKQWLDELSPYKVRPASDEAPDKFETGTQNHEGVAGATAAVAYLAWIGETFGTGAFPGLTGRRLNLKQGMTAIQEYERSLFARLLVGLQQIHGIELYGPTGREQLARRAPTIALNLRGQSPRAVAERLGRDQIYVWDGNYYALAVMERLGLEATGGAVRVGLAHYNTAAEVDRLLDRLP